MNLIQLNQSEDLADLNEKCNAISSSSNPSSPVSASTDDIFGDPILSPRLGDDYQVEILPMLNESEHLAFECVSNTGLTIPIMWVHTVDKKGELEECCKYTAVTGGTSYVFNCNYKDEIVGSTYNHNKAYGSPTCQVTACKGCNPLPESRVSLWSDDDIRSLLLGFYIFGKNMVQVRKFIECKDMKDVLSFYYGKFYHSDAYHRWACCRKSRSRKCIQGQRMFTGWRQQELLSRMLTGSSKEVQDSLLEATKAFNDGRSSLEQLVFTLKAAVGIRALIDAVGIGKGKRDLTGFTLDSGRNNQPAHHPRGEIPAGKACSGISSSEIIKYLTGNFRLSKARSNHLFWEAVWPRLLARGWHSERPRNICSKKSLVFLVPGITKFSRRKLVKGGHYFDSVTEVLNKVASDPRLLDLQTEGTVSDDHRHHPPYLRPYSSSSDADLMKFTVVDTSLVDGPAESSKLRALRSMPFDVLVGGNHVQGSNSDSSMDPSTDASLNDKDSSEESCVQTSPQPEDIIQEEKRTQPEQPPRPAPSAKRQRLSACKQAMRSGCHNLLFAEKTDCGASDVVSTSEDRLYDEKPRRALFDLNQQPQFSIDFDSDPPVCQISKLQHIAGNQTSSSADEEPCYNGRRHSTRNRPPTAKALEALAGGFLNIGRTGKELKTGTPLRGMPSRSRLSRRTAESPPPATAVFTDAARVNLIIPEMTASYHASLFTER